MVEITLITIHTPKLIFLILLKKEAFKNLGFAILFLRGSFKTSPMVNKALVIDVDSFGIAQCHTNHFSYTNLSIKFRVNNLGKIKSFIWNDIHEHVCNAIKV